MSNPDKRLYKFGSFLLNPEERILLHHGQPVRLPPKTFKLLLFFVERSNHVIDKEILMRELWQDAFVEEANLSVHISALRRIFAEDAEKSATIENFPKKGYRFTADVTKINENQTADSAEASKAAESETYIEAANETAGEKTVEVQPEEKSPLNLKNSNYPLNINKKGAFIGLLALILIVTGGYVLNRRFIKKVSAQKITRVRGMEKTVGLAISPNGEYLAQAATGVGKQSLHIIHIATNSSVQLIPPADVLYDGLIFSKDGNYIYYVRSDKQNDSALYQIPILGGESKKVLENVVGTIGFSPDGSRFAFLRNLSDEETALMTADVTGGDERIVATRIAPEFFSTWGLSFSPDGKSIACAVGSNKKDRMTQAAIINVESGELKLISDKKWYGMDAPIWLPDASGLIAAAYETGNAPTQIWFLPYPSGEPYKITNDTNNYGGLGLTADGNTLAAVQFSVDSQVWLIPNNEFNSAKPITYGKHHEFKFVSWTKNGRILFGSSEAGSRDVWIMDADGNNQKQLTANARENGQPTITPDNNHILFTSDRIKEGTYNIWKMNVDGTNPVQLTFGSGEIQPISTPDGKWIVYTNGGTETPIAKRTIWKIPFEGGEPVQITDKPSHWADVSPDGKYIACWYKPDENTPFKIAVIPIEGGQPIKIFDITPTSPIRWTPDGGAISFVKTVDAVSNIWNQPVNGDAPKQITQFTSEQIINFDWSDDNRLICSRSQTLRDVILINDFR